MNRYLTFLAFMLLFVLLAAAREGQETTTTPAG